MSDELAELRAEVERLNDAWLAMDRAASRFCADWKAATARSERLEELLRIALGIENARAARCPARRMYVSDDECARCGHTRKRHAGCVHCQTPCQEWVVVCEDGCCIEPCECKEFKEPNRE